MVKDRTHISEDLFKVLEPVVDTRYRVTKPGFFDKPDYIRVNYILWRRADYDVAYEVQMKVMRASAENRAHYYAEDIIKEAIAKAIINISPVSANSSCSCIMSWDESLNRSATSSAASPVKYVGSVAIPVAMNVIKPVFSKVLFRRNIPIPKIIIPTNAPKIGAWFRIKCKCPAFISCNF